MGSLTGVNWDDVEPLSTGVNWDEVPPLSIGPMLPKYDPTEGMNWLQKGVAGYGGAMMDKWLAVKQLAASMGLGDPEEIRKQVEEKQQIDAPLLATGAGRAGQVIGSIAPELALGGAGGAMLSAATKGAGFLPRALSYAANVPGQGAVSSLLEPDAKEYDPASKAGLGAALGVGTDVGLRALGQVLSPGMFRPSATYADKAAAVEDMGLPSTLAVNRTDSPSIRSMASAMEVLPFGQKASREQNLGWYTGHVTAPTGTSIETVIPENLRALDAPLKAEAQAFRNGPDVPIVALRDDLKEAADQIRQYALATSQKTGVSRIDNAADALAMTPGNRFEKTDVAALLQEPKPYMTANDVFNLRSAASNIAHKTDDPVLEAQARHVRDLYDQALKDTMTPDQAQRFDLWKEKWGQREDLFDTVDPRRPGGQTDAAHVNPKFMIQKMERDTALMPDTPLDQLKVNAPSVIPMPESIGAGYLMRNIALGGGLPLAGGALGYLAGSQSGNQGPGAALGGGALAAALLAGMGTKTGGKWLTGQFAQPETKDLIRQYLLSGALGYENSP